MEEKAEAQAAGKKQVAECNKVNGLECHKQLKDKK